VQAPDCFTSPFYLDVDGDGYGTELCGDLFEF